MKRLIVLILLIGVILCASAVVFAGTVQKQALTAADSESKDAVNISEGAKQMNKVLITAHSGCEGTPENSMEHIQKAIELGADCVEIDINMDDQGGLWLTHNPLEDYSGVLSLEEALRVIAPEEIAVNFDLKTEKALYPVLEAAEAAGIARERRVFSGSVDVGILKKDPSVAERARIFLNLEQLYPHLDHAVPESRKDEEAYFDAHVEEIAAVLKELGAECINPTYKIMPTERIALANEHGIGLSLWTVDKAVKQAILLQEQLVNITTRNVSDALKTRRALGG